MVSLVRSLQTEAYGLVHHGNENDIYLGEFLLTKAKRTTHLNNIARNKAKFCCEITQWEQVDPEDSTNAQRILALLVW